MNCHYFYYVYHQRIIIDTDEHVEHTDKAIYNWKGAIKTNRLNILPLYLYKHFKCKVIYI